STPTPSTARSGCSTSAGRACATGCASPARRCACTSTSTSTGSGRRSTRRSTPARASMWSPRSAAARLATFPKRFSAAARLRAASTSRSRGAAAVTRSSSRCWVRWAIPSTARSNAASFAFDGLFIPLTLRTYWSAAARTSSSVAAGSKLWSTRMFRHMPPSVDAPLVLASALDAGERVRAAGQLAGDRDDVALLEGRRDVRALRQRTGEAGDGDRRARERRDRAGGGAVLGLRGRLPARARRLHDGQAAVRAAAELGVLEAGGGVEVGGEVGDEEPLTAVHPARGEPRELPVRPDALERGGRVGARARVDAQAAVHEPDLVRRVDDGVRPEGDRAGEGRVAGGAALVGAVGDDDRAAVVRRARPARRAHLRRRERAGHGGGARGRAEPVGDGVARRDEGGEQDGEIDQLAHGVRLLPS